MTKRTELGLKWGHCDQGGSICRWRKGTRHTAQGDKGMKEGGLRGQSWPRQAWGGDGASLVGSNRGRFCKSLGLRRMPDVPLKITKYVIFELNQIASSAGFPGGQVVSSTKGFKTRTGGQREAGMENIPYTEVPSLRSGTRPPL